MTGNIDDIMNFLEVGMCLNVRDMVGENPSFRLQMNIIGFKMQEKCMTSKGDIWPPSRVMHTITIFKHKLWVKNSSILCI